MDDLQKEDGANSHLAAYARRAPTATGNSGVTRTTEAAERRPDDNRPLPAVIGGLMRCCIETWETIAPRAAWTKEGDTLDCSYCDYGMVVRDGAWHYNQGYTQSSRGPE